MQMMLAGALFLVFADSLLVPSTHRTPSREGSGRQSSPSARCGSLPIRRRSPTVRQSSPTGSHGVSSSPRGRRAWKSPMKKAGGAALGIKDQGHGMLAIDMVLSEAKALQESFDMALSEAKALQEVRRQLELFDMALSEAKALQEDQVLKDGTVVDKHPKESSYTIADLEKQREQAHLKRKLLIEDMKDAKAALGHEAEKLLDKFSAAADSVATRE